MANRAELRAAVWETRLPDRTCTYVSPNVERLFGYPRQRFLEDKDFWLQCIHPDDREPVAAAYAKPQDGVLTYRVLDANGTCRHVQDDVSVEFDGQGKPVLLRGVLLDVSGEEADRQARHAAVDVLDRVGSTNTDVVWVRTADKMLYISPSYERVWGRTCESLYGNPNSFLDLVHPEDRDSLYQAFDDCIRGVRDFDAEYRIVRSDGEQRIIHGRARVELDEAGNLVREVGLASDVTARHREQQTLRDKQRLESLGVMARGIAHDFNNILQSIVGNTGLAQTWVAPTHSAQPLFAEILKAAGRATDLCRQMLNYAGEVPRPLVPVDLSSEARNMAALLRSALPAGAELDLVADAAPIWAKVDRAQFSQVLLNLVTNAAEALVGRRGRMRVTIDSRFFDRSDLQGLAFGETLADGQYSCLCVEDNGHGIEAERLSRIFDPFSSSKGTGRGLGLSTVLGIVRGHGGAIRVRSQVGVGTTFEIFLPAVAAPEPNPLKSPAQRARTSVNSCRVLLVDDEPGVRNLFRLILEREGHLIHSAASVGEARRLAGAHELDLAVLDVSLPDGDGTELLKELREGHPGLPTILTSGKANVTAWCDLHAVESCVPLPKPFFPSDLLRAVASLAPGARE